MTKAIQIWIRDNGLRLHAEPFEIPDLGAAKGFGGRIEAAPERPNFLRDALVEFDQASTVPFRSR